MVKHPLRLVSSEQAPKSNIEDRLLVAVGTFNNLLAALARHEIFYQRSDFEIDPSSWFLKLVNRSGDGEYFQLQDALFNSLTHNGKFSPRVATLLAGHLLEDLKQSGTPLLIAGNFSVSKQQDGCIILRPSAEIRTQQIEISEAQVQGLRALVEKVYLDLKEPLIIPSDPLVFYYEKTPQAPQGGTFQIREKARRANGKTTPKERKKERKKGRTAFQVYSTRSS